MNEIKLQKISYLYQFEVKMIKFQVWLSTFGTLCIVTLVLWVLTLHSTSEILYPFNNKTTRRNLPRFFWDASFSLVSQSMKMQQNSISRILLCVWFLMGLILIFSYTGTLIAFLTIPVVQKTIQSLEELSNQKKILWTYNGATFHGTLFGVIIITYCACNYSSFLFGFIFFRMLNLLALFLKLENF